MKSQNNQQFSSRDILATYEPRYGIYDSLNPAKVKKIFTKEDFAFIEQQCKVIHSFSLNPGYLPGWKVISGDSIGMLMKSANGNFWGAFKAKYGRMSFYTISMPLFSKDKNIAVIKISDHCGLCGGGATYVYKKEKDVWKMIDKFDEWSS